jgi:VCBS repeat-containing protein
MSMGYWLHKTLFPQRAGATSRARRRQTSVKKSTRSLRPAVESLEDRYLLTLTAVADDYVIGKDTLLNVPAPGLLANDVYNPADNITAVLKTNPTSGTLKFSTRGDGSFSYTPNPGFVGTDSFTYQITDFTIGAFGVSTPTTVSITVLDAQPPLALNDSYLTPVDTNLVTTATNGVLANDRDPAGKPLAASVVTQPLHGTLTSFNADGTFTYKPASGYNGPDSFTYQVSDGTLTATATVNLTVGSISQPPTAQDDSYITNEGSPLTVDAPGLLGNDNDPSGKPLTAQAITNPLHGTLSLNADGSFTYTPDNFFSGTDSFTYKVSDGTLTSNTATVTLTVSSVDHAPIAGIFSFNTPSNTQLKVNAPGVLARPGTYDPDSDPIAATPIDHGTTFRGGTVTLLADGSFTYDPPNATFTGFDSFGYEISDGTLTASGIVNISVGATVAAPTAADDTNFPSVTAGATLSVNAPGVLANDTYDSSHNILVQLAPGGDVSHGTLTLNIDGSFTYVPNGTASTDSFRYFLWDATAQAYSGTATVSLTVLVSGSTLLTANDTASATAGRSVTINVLSNDTYNTAHDVVPVVLSNPSHGSVKINADKTITYTSTDSRFSGTDSFTYDLVDNTTGDISTNFATVSITVTAVPNHPPTATPKNYTASNGTLNVGAAIGVLVNDSDPDGDPLSAVPILNGTTVQGGSVTLNADGSFTYTAPAGYSGPDSFVYQITDGLLTASSGVLITVTQPTSQPPTANDDSYTINQKATLKVDPRGVLANDTDPAGKTLQAVPLNNVATQHGTVSLLADGSFTYTPSDPTYFGTDSFSYQVTNGSLTATATVHITINALPVAKDDHAATEMNQSLSLNLLGDVSDQDSTTLTIAKVNGSTLAVGSSVSTAHGSVMLNADNTLTYTPAANYAGPDQFTYQASDGLGLSNSATVTITVNGAPTAADHSYNASRITPLQVTAANGLLAQASDPNGDHLTAIKVTDPSHGTVTVRADGSFTYTLTDSSYTGPDSFTYQVSDGTDLSNTATVILTILADQPPTAVDQSYSTKGNTVLRVDAPGVLDKASDPEGDPLTVLPLTGIRTSHGSVNLLTDGSFTYMPDDQFSGTDSFTYQVSDGTLTTSATVTITVSPVNQAPTASADSFSINEATMLNSPGKGVLANDSDPDGDSLTAVLVAKPSHGSLTLNADGSFSYMPDANFAGIDNFTYQARDAQGLLSNVALVTINVLNLPPQVTPGANATIQQGNTYSGQGSVSDLGGDVTVVTVDYGDGTGVQPLTLNGNSFALSHRYTQAGTFMVNIAAQDSHGGFSNGTLTVTVQAAGDETLFIRRLYADLLQRDADAGGLSYWMQQLQQGASRSQVAEGIWRSDEHRGMQVDAYYNTFLHRAADAGGRDYWVRAFQNGATESDVEQGFLTSGEYQSTHTTDAAYLAGLYQDVLGRNADPAGLAYWSQILASAGADGRSMLARGFVTSSEAYLNVLDHYYAAYLHRTPDSFGQQSWLNGLLQGAYTLESVALGILSSDEYFHRS